MLKILMVTACLVLFGCSGALPPVDLREGTIAVGRNDPNRELSEADLVYLNGWLQQNSENWERQYFSLPPHPFIAALVMDYTSGQPCALYLYENNVVFVFSGSDGSQWKKHVKPEEVGELKAALGVKSEG